MIRGRSLGEKHEGIQMWGSVVNDANVQLDLMEEENNPRRNRESMGKTNQETNQRGEDSIAQFDSINEDVRVSRERDLDEKGRKFPLYKETTKIGQPNSRSGWTNGQGSQRQSQYEGQITTSTHSSEFYDRYDGYSGLQAYIYETLDVQPTLSLHDDAVETRSSWEGTTETDSSVPVHILPSGKKYHVLFSYDMADRDWVHSVAEKMESVLGYRCSFHERDFHGGKRVIENIMEHIQWSVKTVLVLSPNFLESSWCQFEMKQGLHASIEEARMLIVPVMVRYCEVPDTLRSLTYIDATPGKEWWGRFLEAVLAEDHLQICNADKNQMSIQPKHENLELLCEVSSVFRCCFGEKFDVPYTPEMLKKPGIEVPDAEFHIAASLVREAQHTNCLTRFLHDYIPICSTFTTILSVMPMYCAIFSLMIFFLPNINELDAATKLKNKVKGSFMIVTPLPVLAINFALFVRQLKKRKAAVRKATVNMNRILLQFKVLAGANTSTLGHGSSLRTKMLFYYFDVHQCETHLREYLSGLENALGSEEYSRALIVNFSEEYTRDYKEGKLMYQEGFVNRHVRHVKCLCQYIEDLLSQQESLREFCEQKVNRAPGEIV